MAQLGMTRRDLDGVPAAISLLLHEMLWRCREQPPADWPPEAYFLVQRPELAAAASSGAAAEDELQVSCDSPAVPISKHQPASHEQHEPDDGMEDVDISGLLRLRFPDDRRVAEVRRLLRSSQPAEIRVQQRPEVSDHDFIEEQERHLYAVCTRTMALPVGR